MDLTRSRNAEEEQFLSTHKPPSTTISPSHITTCRVSKEKSLTLSQCKLVEPSFSSQYNHNPLPSFLHQRKLLNPQSKRGRSLISYISYLHIINHHYCSSVMEVVGNIVKRRSGSSRFFKRLRKETLRLKFLLPSLFKWKRLSALQVSFMDNVVFKVLSAFEAIVLVFRACFFYLCCGCNFWFF